MPNLVSSRATHVIGTSGNDWLYATLPVSPFNQYATYLNWQLEGGLGNDTLDGGYGHDNLYGGGGKDLLVGHYGYNYIDGEGGNDTIDYSFFGLDAYVTPVNGVSVNLLTGTAVNRTAGLTVQDEILNVENVQGSRFNDVITGNHASNALMGGDGRDRLDGQGGQDNISGGSGSDVMSGGSGNDYFYFSNVSESSSKIGVDRIMDFERGIDKIVLGNIDANTLTLNDEAFTWRGQTNVFSGRAGDLHFYHSTNSAGVTTTTIRGDINGDRVADLTVNLQGEVALASVDFIL